MICQKNYINHLKIATSSAQVVHTMEEIARNVSDILQYSTNTLTKANEGKVLIKETSINIKGWMKL